MNLQYLRKSNRVLTSAHHLSRRPCLHTRLFAFKIGGSHATHTRWTNTTNLTKYRELGVVALAIVSSGLAAFAGKESYCELGGRSQATEGPLISVVPPQARSSFTEGSSQANPNSDPLPPPKSSLNKYELTFGSLTGICAGIFIKKGAKTVAFSLGGIFVLLQYFNSTDLTKTNWSVASTRFERLFYSPEKAGEPHHPPTIATLWNSLINFLTADFPPRASFLSGLVLGLRVG